MKVSKNFVIQEFVTPKMYKDLGDKAIILIDERIIQLAQYVRDRFKKSVTVNNWYYGGEYKYRGVRPYNCKVGAKYSQHKYGRAFDFTVEGISIKELHKDINKNQKEYFANHLRAVESIHKADTWMHFDVRFSNLNDIFWF